MILRAKIFLVLNVLLLMFIAFLPLILLPESSGYMLSGLLIYAYRLRLKLTESRQQLKDLESLKSKVLSLSAKFSQTTFEGKDWDDKKHKAG